MTFLELVNRLRRKCRVSGAGPTSVANQIEEYARLVDWINEAWMDIQLRRSDWKWMRETTTFPTVAGQAVYTVDDIENTGTGGFSDEWFGHWDLDSFRQYHTAAGLPSEIEIGAMDFDDWRNLYEIGANRDVQSAPVTFATTPDFSIALGPTPLDGYTISAAYYLQPNEMIDDADVPTLPAQFHMALVYRAMMFYGVSEAAPEIYDDGADNYRRLIKALEVHQLPPMTWGGVLS